MSNYKAVSTRYDSHRNEPIRLSRKQIITPDALRPRTSSLAVVGVLNPGFARVGGARILIARVDEIASLHAVQQAWDRYRAEDAIPYFDVECQKLEMAPIYTPPNYDPDFDELIIIGEKECYGRLRQEGLRQKYTSHIRAIFLDDELHLVSDRVLIEPSSDLDKFGCEDPRAFVSNGVLFITYNGIGRSGSTPVLARLSADFAVIERHILQAPDQKHPCIFSHADRQSYFLVTRPLVRVSVKAAGIWLYRSTDLRHWAPIGPVLLPRGSMWDSARVGPGPPPLKTERGWLFFYYGVDAEKSYHVGVVLLDLDNPARVIKRIGEPLLSPAQIWELEGRRADTVFPGGLDVVGDTVSLYYGAADTSVGVATFSLADLLDYLNNVQADRERRRHCANALTGHDLGRNPLAKIRGIGFRYRCQPPYGQQLESARGERGVPSDPIKDGRAPGGALVKFIEAKAITFTPAAFVVTCVGLGLIFTGLHWQAESAAAAKDPTDDIQ